ncbi:hypothetical protein BDR06DRAFT_1015773 [Suillus hirtellus]|nr:hypothetical protein BDR06DRAFT_1015773 [Suillus hirtellus]
MPTKRTLEYSIARGVLLMIGSELLMGLIQRPWVPASPPSASLPTPPSHKPVSPDASRFAVECYGFTEDDIAKVSGSSIGTGYQS